MRLDRVPPRRTEPGPSSAVPGAAAGPAPIAGTADPGCGVSTDVHSKGEGEPHVRRGRLRIRFLVALAALALLGEGERSGVDPRFSTPTATLATYWSALRDGDAATMRECVTDDADGQPFPGMLWFMPPTRTVWLESFRSLPVTAGRLFVTYEVRFRPIGALEEQRFPTGHELVRSHGRWRIARGLGPASYPSWRPIARTVDI